MSKEIGKLIELLNEYEDPMVSWYEKYDEETGFFILNNGQKAYEEVIVGKAYGFIQWLVRNEKIDRHKFYDKNILKGFMTLTKEEKSDSIIMNLAIQDEPIEFLISILKQNGEN